MPITNRYVTNKNICVGVGIIVINTNNNLVHGKALVFYFFVSYVRLFSLMVYIVLVERGYFWCIMVALRNSLVPISTIHYTLPRFILKDPGLQLLGNRQKQRVVPGGIDQSKDHPRDHERRMTPPQDLSFRYQWDGL